MSQFQDDKLATIQLVIATTNVHKIREIRSILQPLKQFDLLSLLDFPHYQPPEEIGKTFKENASLKAIKAAKELKKWVIADDSGLVIPALKGEPGVFSARYAGENATDKDNRKKLLIAMENIKNEDRFGFYECAIALASPDGLIKCVSATCEGTIVSKERGGGGFGYDPIFEKHEYSKTFAELEETIKNRISHRRKAIEKIMLAIETL